MTIFLVEDNAIVCKHLTEAIHTDTNHTVIGIAATAADALWQVPVLLPQIIVLDIQLNEGNGFEVLRGFPTLVPKPKFIVLSNNTDAHFRQNAARLGAEHFFDKSFEFPQFITLLRSIAPLE